MLCDEWGIDVADALLRFDRTAGRWEYSIGDITTWVNTESPTALLQIARNVTGRLVGFTFDVDVSDPSYVESINDIRREFGDDIAQRVSSEPTDDVELLIATSSSLAETADDGVDVMRLDARLQRASSDVVITDNRAAGIVTVTMTVPWWARFTKPWVAIRRRGKRDILLTGPMRVRGRTAKATLRYGMPYSGSSLTADIVKGPRTVPWTRVAAVLLALSVVAVGLVWNRRGDDAPYASQSLQESPPFFRVDDLTPQGACSSFGDKVVAVGLQFDVDAGKPIVFGAYADLPQTSDFRQLKSQVLSDTTMEIEIPSPSLYGSSVVDPSTIWLVWSYTDELNIYGPKIARKICD